MTPLKVAIDLACIGAAFAGEFDWVSVVLLTLAAPSLLWTVWHTITADNGR